MKSFFFTIIAIVICGLSPAALQAQTVVVTKRQVSSQGLTERSTTKKRSRHVPEHAITYNFSAFLLGDLPLGYSYRPSDFMTIEAGLGITSNNFVDELNTSLFYNSSSLFDNSSFYSGASQTPISGSAHAGLKFFPEGDAFNDGMYLGAQLTRRNYRKGFTDGDSTVTASKLFLDLGLTLGYQLRPSDHIMVDWYIGLANRSIRWDRVESLLLWDPASNQNITTTSINPVSDKWLEGQPDSYTTIGLLMGLKVGYFF